MHATPYEIRLETFLPRLQRWAALGAGAQFVLNGVWLGTIIALMQIGPPAEHATAQPGLFRVSVGAALLLTLCQVPVLAAAGLTAALRGPVRGLLGAGIAAFYIPLNVTAYFLYGAMMPELLSQGTPAATALAHAIEIGGPMALFGMLPLMGYGLLSVGWVLMATALWGRSRLWTATAVLMLIGAVPTIAGTVGAYLAIPWLAVGCFVGGILSLPSVGLLALALWTDPGAASMRRKVPGEGISLP